MIPHSLCHFTHFTHFVSIVFSATALYAESQWRVNDPIAIAENNITVSQDLLIQRSLELCDIFSYEFIFCKPCQELKMVVLQAIENLSHRGIITLQEVYTILEQSACVVDPLLSVKLPIQLRFIPIRNAVCKKNCGVRDTRKSLMIVQTRSIITETRPRLPSTKYEIRFACYSSMRIVGIYSAFSTLYVIVIVIVITTAQLGTGTR